MEPEGGRPPGVDHSVVELDAVGEPTIQRPAARFVEGSPPLVDQQRIVRGVELNVGAAEPDQFPDLFAHDLDDIGHESVEIGIGGGGLLR